MTTSATTRHAQDMNISEVPMHSPLTLVDSKCWVVSLYVIDDKRRSAKPIQLLLPSSHLAELDKLNQALDADFRALNDTEQRIYLADSASKEGSAEQNANSDIFAQWERFERVVDDNLLSKDELFFEAGDSRALKVDQASFLKLTESSRYLAFSRPAPSSPLDRKSDEQAVLNSVKQFTERRIEQRLAETLELPPLPRTTQRIIELRSKPNADVDELAEIVETDPALAAQIVSWAGSPYYRAPGEIKSVHDAIVRVLGFDMVLNLALGLSLGRHLSFKQISQSELQAFWRNSMLMAVTSESLATGMAADERPDRGQTYLCGLLCELGYLILGEVFPLYFQQIRRQHQVNSHLPRVSIEQAVLGITQYQIAACLLENWQMPTALITAVRFAEQADYQDAHHELSKLLLCARHMLAKYGLLEQTGKNVSDTLLHSLNIDAQCAEKKIEQIQEATASFEQGLTR